MKFLLEATHLEFGCRPSAHPTRWLWETCLRLEVGLQASSLPLGILSSASVPAKSVNSFSSTHLL